MIGGAQYLKELDYTARMTGEPYLYFETKVVAKLMYDKVEKEKMLDMIKEENLFQYKTKKSVNKIFNAVYKRLCVLDEYLLNIVANYNSQESKIIVLYGLMKTNRLFFEFMNEVFREKINERSYKLNKSDIMAFFDSKREQSEKVAKWHDYTLNKLSQVFTKTLLEAGLINNKVEKRIVIPSIDKGLIDHFIEIGDAAYIKAMMGDMII